jgi:hypothetical protein
MGLLSSVFNPRTLRGIAKGAGRSILATIEEERENSETYLATLAAAKEDVNNEGKIIGDNYNKALRVMESTGNTGFNNFLFTTQSIDKLANMSDLAPTTLDEQLKQLKFSYENLPDDKKASYETGNYSEIAKKKYDTEIDKLKISKGLVNNNRMGENTLEALITKNVRAKGKEEEDKIISQAITPELDIPTVAEGEGIYGSIGETAFEDSRLKLMIDQDYIDGTLEELVRYRLIQEGNMMTPNEEIEKLKNIEYNRQVNAAKQIFMSQGDDLIVNTKQQINTNKDIDDLLG